MLRSVRVKVYNVSRITNICVCLSSEWSTFNLRRTIVANGSRTSWPKTTRESFQMLLVFTLTVCSFHMQVILLILDPSLTKVKMLLVSLRLSAYVR